jgi:hypothetical protein
MSNNRLSEPPGLQVKPGDSLRFALGNTWNRQFFDSVFNLQKK